MVQMETNHLRHDAQTATQNYIFIKLFHAKIEEEEEINNLTIL